MSRLSDERIDEFLEAVLNAGGSSLRYYTLPKSVPAMREAARAIEREVLKEVKVQIPTATMEQEFAWHQRQGFIRGHRQGQKAMREKAASKAAEEAGEYVTDSDGWYICKSLSHQIEELEIEEPTK